MAGLFAIFYNFLFIQWRAQHEQNILKSIDVNKANEHDDISIRMLKLSQKPILKPLKLIFENCLRTRIFPDQWKKANVLIHKKGDKQLIEN